jgi:hypothetical protein
MKESIAKANDSRGQAPCESRIRRCDPHPPDDAPLEPAAPLPNWDRLKFVAPSGLRASASDAHPLFRSVPSACGLCRCKHFS